jgi:hypothetical protein
VKPPRIILTLRLMTVVVALAALSIWAVTDVFVNAPRRQARRERIAYHMGRAEYLARWKTSSTHLISPKLSSEMSELSSWHYRRAREISQASDADLANQRQIDALHSKIESAVLADMEDATSHSY